MLVYNIGFTNTYGIKDETQIDIEEYEKPADVISELMNLVLELKTEMDIRRIDYIDFIGKDDESDV